MSETDHIVTSLLDDLRADLVRREEMRQREIDELHKMLLEQHARHERDLSEMSALIRGREDRIIRFDIFTIYIN